MWHNIRLRGRHATKLASKLQSPDGLTTLGDNVYGSTTYGYATQEEAQYNHDIGIKPASGRAKRLYKGLYGASWGQVVTKNGIYEINEGYASVIRYPLDGSKADGESLVHAIYGNDQMPEVGVVKLAADDNGFVVSTRTADGDRAPGDVTAYTPAGKSATKLGSVPGAASALVLAGDKVLVGTSAGDALLGWRERDRAWSALRHRRIAWRMQGHRRRARMCVGRRGLPPEI